MPVLHSRELVDLLTTSIRQFHREAGTMKASLDVSGGIDSAVMAGLLVLALGADAVVFDHSIMKTNPVQTARAERVIAAVGGKLAIVEAGAAAQQLTDAIIASMVTAGVCTQDQIGARLAADPTILGSIRSTLRAPIGRAYNRLFGGGIRHGTGNECEDRFLRFYQKGGDGEVDTNPISSLSKGEVYQVALELGKRFEALGFSDAVAAFQEIIDATPSPDLWGQGDAHSDEAELSKLYGVEFTYSRINPAGQYVRIGTIERVARTLDLYVSGFGVVGPTLFSDRTNGTTLIPQLYALFEAPAVAALWEGYDAATFTSIMLAAKRAERTTRHKLNPAIPTILTRQELLRLGLITDKLTLAENPSWA